MKPFLCTDFLHTGITPKRNIGAVQRVCTCVRESESTEDKRQRGEKREKTCQDRGKRQKNMKKSVSDEKTPAKIQILAAGKAKISIIRRFTEAEIDAWLQERGYSVPAAFVIDYWQERRWRKPDGSRPVSVEDCVAWATDRVLVVDGMSGRRSGLDIGWRGISLGSGEEVFRYGPVPDGTNNIAEFLAVVHAMAMLVREGKAGYRVYTDSMTAMSWVRRCKCCTRHSPDPAGRLSRIIRRAERWLDTHGYASMVLKWHTRRWGENPADFGRKK